MKIFILFIALAALVGSAFFIAACSRDWNNPNDPTNPRETQLFFNVYTHTVDDNADTTRITLCYFENVDGYDDVNWYPDSLKIFNTFIDSFYIAVPTDAQNIVSNRLQPVDIEMGIKKNNDIKVNLQLIVTNIDSTIVYYHKTNQCLPENSLTESFSPEAEDIYKITVTAEDAYEHKISRNFVYNVIDGVNNPPQILFHQDLFLKFYEDKTYTFTLNDTLIYDPDPEDRHPSILKLEILTSNEFYSNWIKLDGTPTSRFAYGDNVTIQPEEDWHGSFLIDMILSDGKETDTKGYKIFVKNLNDPPVISDIADQTTDEDALFQLQVYATDPDGDTRLALV